VVADLDGYRQPHFKQATPTWRQPLAGGRGFWRDKAAPVAGSRGKANFSNDSPTARTLRFQLDIGKRQSASQSSMRSLRADGRTGRGGDNKIFGSAREMKR
jgi:hypothetical protein